MLSISADMKHRMLKQEKKDFYFTQNRNREIMLGPKRKLFLDDYVQEVRTNLHEQRAIEKREKLNAQLAAYVATVLLLYVIDLISRGVVRVQH